MQRKFIPLSGTFLPVNEIILGQEELLLIKGGNSNNSDDSDEGKGRSISGIGCGCGCGCGCSC